MNPERIAEAFNAVIFAFNVDIPPSLAVQAKQNNIEVKRHNVIYKLVDEVKQPINGKSPTTQHEELIGR
ncbi:unnamed protein product [Pieris macdunnoughi]|uniref:Translation initiation factor IF- 2 domain-containing protein n=1 Tax=Pieris macdunnoughi TaxID=345717 RepID=A0A821MES6_9NEOP|nr:unnamed protein product [Pieris macdunnoughi]